MKRNVIIVNILLLLIVALSSRALGNEFDFHWGEIFKTSKYMMLKEIVCETENGYIAIGGYKDRYHLVQIDQSMKHLAEVRIDKLKFKGDKLEFNKIAYFDDNLHLFSTLIDKKQKKNILYVQQLNQKTLIPEETTKIAEIDFDGYSKRNSGAYTIKTTNDGSKILVFYEKPTERNENTKIGFKVFDKKLNELWGKNIELPYQQDLIDFHELLLDKNGDVHFLCQIYFEDRKLVKDDKQNSVVKVINYFQSGETKEYELKSTENYLFTPKMTIDKNNDIVVAGYYVESEIVEQGNKFKQLFGERALDHSNGSYFSKINLSTKEQSKLYFLPFAEDNENFITNIDNLYLDSILVREDGNIIIIGEQYEQRSIAQGDKYVLANIYNKIVVTCFDPNGEKLWEKVIKKRQGFPIQFLNPASYGVVNHKNKLFIIFNDNTENHKNRESGKLSYGAFYKYNDLTVIMTLDSQGEVIEDRLTSSYESNTMILPIKSKQFNNDVLIHGAYKKQMIFGKLKLK